jgi:hypothetical protein
LKLRARGDEMNIKKNKTLDIKICVFGMDMGNDE